MFRCLCERKEAMRQHSRPSPFADLRVDCDLLDPSRVGEPKTQWMG